MRDIPHSTLATIAFDMAVGRGDVGTARRALEQGAHTDRLNGSGQTALSEVARNATTPINREMIELLGKVPGLLEMPNSYGRTPLMEAARTGRDWNVELLLSLGAQVHTQESTSGLTALAHAITSGNRGCAQALVRLGGWDMSYQTQAGDTPESLAERYFATEEVSRLRELHIAWQAGQMEASTPQAGSRSVRARP